MTELHEKAAELFAAGESVNAVAMALFNKNYAKAKKQHGLWTAQQGGATDAVAEAEAEPEAPEMWDLNLMVTVPVKRLVPMFKMFTAEEQATGVQYLLQRRMEAAVGGE